jgi:hypothetical protein
MLILPLTSLHSGILENLIRLSRPAFMTGHGCFLMKLAVIDLANLEPVLEPFFGAGTNVHGARSIHAGLTATMPITG